MIYRKRKVPTGPQPREKNIFVPPPGGTLRSVASNYAASLLAGHQHIEKWDQARLTSSRPVFAKANAGARRLFVPGTLQTLMPTMSISTLGGEADMAGPRSNVR